MKNTQDIIHPVLTISLLVSNRIDTIRKCLESLQPLMKAIPSELIAVDTGGTDGSIGIVTEYTKNIVKFNWCDDFAAARNAGLKIASGEWFLFLDDDEWFEDTEEIEEFFLTGTYKSYGSAQYLVRNYTSDGNWADAYVSRMCQISPNLHFAGSIHEYLLPVCAPVKYFNSFVHHYGYCYNSEEDKKRHFERNVTLLKKELHKDPTNVRNLCQLAQEYETVSDLKNEEAICRLALNNIHDVEIAKSTAMNWIMAALIRILAVQDRDEDTLKEGKKLLNRGLPYELSRAVILAYIQEKAVKVQAYTDAIVYAKEYIRMIELLEADPEMTNNQSMMTMTFSYAQGLYGIVMANGLEACCGAMDFRDAYMFLNWLFDKEKNADSKNIYSYIESLKEKYPSAKANIIEQLASISNTESSSYLLLQRFLLCVENEEGNIQQIYNSCLLRCLEEKRFYADLLCAAGKKGISQSEALAQFERKEWEDWLMASLPHITTEELWGVKKGILEVPGNSLKRLSFIATTDRQILIRETEDAKKRMTEGNENLNCSRYMAALAAYSQEGSLYFTRLYSKEAIYDENGINLPKECRFLFYIEKALEAEKENEFEECLKNVRSAVQVNASMAETLSEYVKRIEKKASVPRTNEFLALGQTLKKKARELIAVQETEMALTILRQLEKLMPDDKDVLFMLQEISSANKL